MLVVFDDDADTTVAPLRKYAAADPRVVPDAQHLRARARRGRSATASTTCSAPVVVVTMADGSDDAEQIDELCKLVERGVVVAAASRYMSGGQQIGGPVGQERSSRASPGSRSSGSRTSARATRPTRSRRTRSSSSATCDIDSDTGFEIGIELVAKARRLRRPVAEIPTIWLERAHGASNFKVAKWIPRYLKWYRFAFGPQAVARRRARSRKGTAVMTDARHSDEQKVLVSGSSGFIGGYVVEELLGRGYTVVGIDNHSKYGQVEKSYDDHPRLHARRGRLPRRRAHDRSCSWTATTSSPAPR